MAQDSQKHSTTSLKQMPKRSFSRNLPRYALIFLAGLLVGWFVFGWWLFPIEYTQVYPNELHTDARNDYFEMVAEGYTLTGDRIQAAQRLQYWNVDDELPRVVNARIQALEMTDPDAAESLRRMAEELHLTQTTAIPKAPSQTLEEVSGGVGRTVLLFLAGVLVLVLLWVLYKRVIASRSSAIPQRAPASERRAPAPAPEPEPEVEVEVDEGVIDGDFEAIETLGDAPEREESYPPLVEKQRIETVSPPIYPPQSDVEATEEDDWEMMTWTSRFYHLLLWSCPLVQRPSAEKMKVSLLHLSRRVIYSKEYFVLMDAPNLMKYSILVNLVIISVKSVWGLVKRQMTIRSGHWNFGCSTRPISKPKQWCSCP